MMEHATGLFYCHEYPHIDMYERGAETVGIAQRIVDEGLVLHRRLELLPLIIPGSTTFSGPGKVVTARAYELEKTPGVIDVSFTHGFPHTDVPVITTSVLVTTDNDPDLAERIAREIVDLIYATIDDFRQLLPSPEEVVREALAAEALPVVIAEVSDNPGGGAPGNGTHLLRALLDANEPLTAFGFIWDPTVAAHAHGAGPGATIDISLGGFSDDLHGAPIETSAYVKCVTDGIFTLTTPMGAGRRYNLGKMARLVIGNVDVIVGSERSQTLDAELFLLHGIDVTRYRIVALKSMQHFRGGFQPIAGTILRTDPPGYTTSNHANMPWTATKHPLWPIDSLPAYPEGVEIIVR
jgi:microcystin degradation protein MlrC